MTVDAAQTIDDRRLPRISGAVNLRDLGGYRTADGHQLRWGVLFRSGSLAEVSAEAWSQLQALGIRAICDLRTTDERQRAPFPWAAAAGLNYYCRDYRSSFGELRRLMTSSLPSADAAREGMLAAYRRLPFEQAPAYRQVFLNLAENQVPMIFNCSAGKDRTGVAAALLLAALGVPTKIIIEDFVLTNTTGRLRERLAGLSANGSLATHPADVVNAVLSADPSYLTAAFDEVTTRCGSIEIYCEAELGIRADELSRIRSNLLERSQ